jgi:aldose sugar dehydrogenase
MVKIKLLVVLLFAAATAALLLTDNAANPRARAYSTGPPAGYTHATGELDCSDCHTTPAQSSGTLKLDAPQKYTPGQTYDVTVTHASADPTRVRWGFELTALDAADRKTGTLASADDLTQVVEGQGPFPARQYAEHTQKGTFSGQQNGASWTFRWTAPAEDVGAVTFYAAGNQANGDGNSSGDNIYFTFATAAFQAAGPDFSLTITPASRTVTPGGAAVYNVTVTPSAGFTGTVTLGSTGLPAGATAAFQPASVQITNSSPQTSVLTLNTNASTPTGTSTPFVNAASGQLTHTAQATLNVVAPTDADLAVAQAVSPNPAQANADITYTITVTNNGPALATSPTLRVSLSGNLTSFAKGAGQCTLVPGPNQFEYGCVLTNLLPGASTTIDFTVRPAAPGTLNTTTTAAANEHDPFPSNNVVNAAVPVASVGAGPSMTAPGLGVRTITTGLSQPTGLAFIGAEDFLVLEKDTGRVLRVKDGAARGAVLDLAVNSASERGLLGIALHPNFATNGYVYLYWTESVSGADTTAIDDVPLLGNRVDRFVWDGARLTFDRTLQRLRALQTDAGQPSRGNHNGGRIRFGPDGKLYVLIGDNGRRGLLQNLACGPTVSCPGATTADDQFGGPDPDDAHLTGVILRLNDDGTTPSDNPFFNAATSLTGQAAANVKKVFAYGIRNGFGMDFDPSGGQLWTQENGDDAFDEINRVEAGFDGGWIQLMGPSARVSEFKAIEAARGNSLQQNRWPPSNTADTPSEALARLYALPGSHYTEPEFSWKYAVAPSPIGFARGAGLGAAYAGDLFVGASRTTLLGGYLMRFKLSGDRKTLATTDARLADKVADNADKFDLAESESLVVGRDFGITTDIQTEPSRGGLYVVSLSNGAVYEVFAATSNFRLDVADANVSEGAGVKTVNVVRLGDTSTAAAVDYATADGTASERSDYTTARGTLRFAPGETQKTLDVLITDDGLTETAEGFNLVLSNPTGQTTLGSPASVTLNILDNDQTPPAANPIDGSQFFVRQHYRDFLNREPDADGLQFWTNEIEKCGPDQQCREVRRINVSAAFFLSIEFQRTGFLAYLANRAAFGNSATAPQVPVRYAGFEHDVQTLQRGYVFGQPGAEAVLEANRRAYFDEFVARPEFVSKYGNLLNSNYVSALLATARLDTTVANIHVARLDAAQQVPPNNSTARGAFVLRRPPSGGDFNLTLSLTLSGLNSPATAVHIHGPAAAGAEAPVLYTLPAGEFADVHVALAPEHVTYLLDGNLYVDVHTAANPGGEIRGRIPPQRFRVQALADALDQGTLTRAQVLRIVAESEEIRAAEFRRAFVLMQYFGYLRRDPDAAGFDFWLSKLDAFEGDYVRAEMVKAFISSVEYRNRFGQ